MHDISKSKGISIIEYFFSIEHIIKPNIPNYKFKALKFNIINNNTSDLLHYYNSNRELLSKVHAYLEEEGNYNKYYYILEEEFGQNKKINIKDEVFNKMINLFSKVNY